MVRRQDENWGVVRNRKNCPEIINSVPALANAEKAVEVKAVEND
jgi:hypothetical protein